jgi:hypothetical protein
MVIELQDNTVYIDGFDKKHKIMGRTLDHPEWVWSLGGFWFERSTGRRVSFTKKRGHFVCQCTNPRNLQRKFAP